MISRALNHFSLQAAKWNGVVLFALAVVWIGVIICVVSSILAQPFDRKQRVFWIIVVVALPFLGVLSYLPFSFNKEALPPIFLGKKKRSRKENRNFDSSQDS